MTKKDFFTLTFKIFGFYCLVKLITSITPLIQFILSSICYPSNGTTWIMFGGLIMSSILYLLFGLVLIFRTQHVLKIFRISVDKKELNITIDKIDVLEESFIVISVLAIVSSLPSVLYHLIFNNFSEGNSLLKLIQLIIGIVLLLNARYLSKWTNRRGIKDDEIDSGSRNYDGKPWEFIIITNAAKATYHRFYLPTNI